MGVHFEIKNIFYHTQIELENEQNKWLEETGSYKLGKSFETNRYERVYGKLKINDGNYPTTLSMFGTDRKIENISVEIYKVEKKLHKVKEGYCRIVGYPEFSTEIDFRNETTPDYITISLGLKEDEYEDIVKRIKDK